MTNSTIRFDAQTRDEMQFCAATERACNVQAFHPTQATILQSVLSKRVSCDPFATSAGYLLATGRRGLWAWQEGSDTILFCLHPNLRDTVLVFFTHELRDLSAIERCIRTLSGDAVRWTIVRVPMNNFLVGRYLEALECYKPVVVQEKHLDWCYPVHTIDINNLKSLRGDRLRHVRNAVNRHCARIETRRFNPNDKDQLAAINQVGEHWSKSVSHKHRHQSNDQCDNSFFTSLTELSRTSCTRVQGLVFYFNGDCVGFSFYESSDVVNLLALQVLPGQPRLSEYAAFATALGAFGSVKQLFCFGGSETHGMDQFKRKFDPVSSIDLISINLFEHDTGGLE